jgi:hypothetical protein
MRKKHVLKGEGVTTNQGQFLVDITMIATRLLQVKVKGFFSFFKSYKKEWYL